MHGIKATKSAFGWFRFMMRRNEISAKESTSADAHLCSQVNIRKFNMCTCKPIEKPGTHLW